MIPTEWMVTAGAIFVLVIALVQLIRRSRQLSALQSVQVNYLGSTKEIKETLIYAFRERLHEEKNPQHFPRFVAGVLATRFGGTLSFTPPEKGLGVDIYHRRPEGMYLVCIKQSNEPLDFESIAIVHSQMVKEKAAGACVITGGSFTNSAKSYAEDVGIEWIDGCLLMEYWLQNVTTQAEAWDAYMKSDVLGKDLRIQEG
ncbi:restriction endonuclease [Marininema halotolerans]|uniref:Restriction system protein n=1 Tax=Marininema halotolerans TaxID=1155944 RepID=A0A1I6NU69_9BACL|nr:restriction endonuclease [Marininema halotolerans]SFS31502.1 restriction system protein [Marininema halotolerans]